MKGSFVVLKKALFYSALFFLLAPKKGNNSKCLIEKTYIGVFVWNAFRKFFSNLLMFLEVCVVVY